MLMRLDEMEGREGGRGGGGYASILIVLSATSRIKRHSHEMNLSENYVIVDIMF